jgi:hypothetical protein
VSASQQEDFAANPARVYAVTICNSLKVLELRQNLRFCSETHRPSNSSMMMKKWKVKRSLQIKIANVIIRDATVASQDVRKNIVSVSNKVFLVLTSANVMDATTVTRCPILVVKVNQTLKSCKNLPT